MEHLSKYNMIFDESYLEKHGVLVESLGVREWCPKVESSDTLNVLAAFYDQNVNKKKNYFLTIEKNDNFEKEPKSNLFGRFR